MTRLLFLGETGLGQTSLMRLRAFERLGFVVKGVHTTEPWTQAGWATRQWQRRTHRGSVVNAINRLVTEAARAFKPDLVWAEKQEHLRPDTLEFLRRSGATLIHFTPDPYFAVPWKRTRLMDEAIRHFDILVYCKRYEHLDYEATGRPIIYMPLGYCDEIHRPLLSADSRWQSDVAFLGGWEPRRERLIKAVAATGAFTKVWGGYWDFLKDGRWTLRRHLILRQLAGDDQYRVHRDELVARTLQGGEVYEDDYARALSGARIGLGLLRSAWPDQHTTRTFEIPACGSMLLADRTNEHREFFEEGREAEFFGSQEELQDKLRFYTRRDNTRTNVAAAGRRRCISSRYAYIHRLKAVLEKVLDSHTTVTTSSHAPGASA